MKNITLRADENLIKDAYAMARSEGKSLNAAFREWLTQYAGRQMQSRETEALFEHLRAGNSGGRRFTRDEMNERR